MVCREANPDTPCTLDKEPKNAQYYTESNGEYNCIYKIPEITNIEYNLIEMYNSCGMAMTDGLTNYNVLLEVAKSHGFTHFDDIIYLAGCIDNERLKGRK